MNDDHFDEVDRDLVGFEDAPEDDDEPTPRVENFVVGCGAPGCACDIAADAAGRLRQSARFLERVAYIVEARHFEGDVAAPP